MQSYENAHRGDDASAWRNALAVLRLTKRHPYSAPINHLWACRYAGDAARCLSNLAGLTRDSDALTSALAEMGRLDPFVNYRPIKTLDLVSSVGELRAFARQGKSVDLSSRHPAGYFIRQSRRLITGGDNSIVGDFVAMYKFNRRMRDMTGRELDAAADVVSAIKSEVTWIPFRWSASQQLLRDTRKIRTDLARLKVASRLAELQRGPTDLNPDAIVASLRPPPNDWLSNMPYRWNAGKKQFYSIGSDGRDDHMSLTYDPTNGLISPGDVWLP
jgi:hypothetical protein